MIEILQESLKTALGSAPAIGILLGGVVLGVLIGVIPGLSGAVVLSITLAFVYSISLQATIVLFLGVAAASFFSASVASILMNIPAHPESFPVTLDGYPMAVRGEAARALGISATSTAIGGVIGCICLVGIFQVITPLTVLFHAPEYVAIITLAMLLVATQSRIPTSKALISVGIGFLVASIGTSTITGSTRFDFGSPYLLTGIPLSVVAIGIFAVPQMVMIFGTGTSYVRQDFRGRRIDVPDETPRYAGKDVPIQIARGVRDTLRHWRVLVQGAAVGVASGIIPGIGGFTANYISYGIAQRLVGRRGVLFGTGVPEGIIAPESSSISKEAGGLVPTLGLGIPHGTASALFLSALAIQDVNVGIGFVAKHQVIAYEMVWVIGIAGVLGAFIGIVMVPLLIRITRIPGLCLFPLIISTCAVGTYLANVSFFYEWELCVIGIAGLVLRRLGYSLPTLLMGVVLGSTFESNIYLTHTLYSGASFLWKRPDATLIFALAVGVLVLNVVQRSRIAKARGNKEIKDSLRQILRIGRGRSDEQSQYPVLELAVSSTVFVASVLVLCYSFWFFSFGTGALPEVAAATALVGALMRLPTDARACLSARAERKPSFSDVDGYGVGSAKMDSTALLGPGFGAEPSGPAFAEAEMEGARKVEIPAVLTRANRDEQAAELNPRLLSLRSANFGSPVLENRWGLQGQYSREIAAFGWLFGTLFLTYLVGFEIGIPVFCFIYGLIVLRRVFSSLAARAIFSAGSAVAFYLLVAELFHVLTITDKIRIF